MTAPLLIPLLIPPIAPPEQRVVLEGVSWQQYEAPSSATTFPHCA